MTPSTLCLVIAVVLFALGAFSRWWASPQPYYPTLLCAGLFFWALSTLIPQIAR